MNVPTTNMEEIEPFFKAHIVGGVPLYPASMYLQIILQALAQQNDVSAKGNNFIFQNVTLDHPLWYTRAQHGVDELNIQTGIDYRSAGEMQFSSASYANEILCARSIRMYGETTQIGTNLFAREAADAERIR